MWPLSHHTGSHIPTLGNSIGWRGLWKKCRGWAQKADRQRKQRLNTTGQRRKGWSGKLRGSQRKAPEIPRQDVNLPQQALVHHLQQHILTKHSPEWITAHYNNNNNNNRTERCNAWFLQSPQKCIQHVCSSGQGNHVQITSKSAYHLQHGIRGQLSF